MNRYSSENAEDPESDQEGDPEQLLNEWLGELDNLTGVSQFLHFSCVYHKIGLATKYIRVFLKEKGTVLPFFPWKRLTIVNVLSIFTSDLFPRF